MRHCAKIGNSGLWNPNGSRKVTLPEITEQDSLEDDSDDSIEEFMIPKIVPSGDKILEGL